MLFFVFSINPSHTSPPCIWMTYALIWHDMTVSYFFNVGTFEDGREHISSVSKKSFKFQCGCRDWIFSMVWKHLWLFAFTQGLNFNPMWARSQRETDQILSEELSPEAGVQWQGEGELEIIAWISVQKLFFIKVSLFINQIVIFWFSFIIYIPTQLTNPV